MDDTLLSVREACARIGMTKTAVLKAIKTGRLVATRDSGNHWRISAQSARDYQQKDQSQTIKRCVVCGAEFAASPTSKKITCSPECSATRKRETHLGKANTWTDESRQALSARGETPNLKLGTPAAQLSPISGPFETNQEAKIWFIRYLPTGEEFEVRNLNKWARDNAESLAPDPWQNAVAGLRRVNASLRGKTRTPVSRWKDWTLYGVSMRPEDRERGKE